MDHDISFGRIVREHRQALGLTQAELARRVGCATVTVRKIEYDALRPSQQIAELLAKALNIPLEERLRFVRLARAALRETPEPSPLPTPPPAPDEIGDEDLSGRAVRGYQLGERIGEGGFGAVYRAVQPFVEREVAIKIILPQYADHPDFIRRFEAEAQLVARLEHPYIVPLYDYWREPGAAYLVMRIMRGGSLSQALREGPLALERVAALAEQVGAALHAAHRVGVVHRDLKPANVLLDEEGNGYLADFGIAKNLSDPDLADLTQAGAIVGSPAYASPEQIRAEPVRPQADIYCLGVLLYELLTGQRPFTGPTPIDYIQQHLHEPLPPLDAYSAVDVVVRQATAKDPLDRYPDIPALLAALRQAAAAEGAAVSAEIPYALTAPDEELENPYKGLRPFGEADADDFYGRETLVQELLGRLAGTEGTASGAARELARFMAVVGPSGSGKSSAVKAGLIPALRRGGLPGSDKWFVVDLTPGPHPMEELEAALLRVAVNPPESLLAQLREDERGLLRAVRRVLPADPEVELVLILDQFEEVFTLVEDEAVRAHLLDSLLTAVLDPRSRLRVVVTLRADFVGAALQYVDFGELVRGGTAFVLPLSPDELEQAIVGPAARVGLVIEPGLVATVVQDVGNRPGMLPMLQYALTELFERREGRLLTLAAYRDIGGVSGALARRAEEVFVGLDTGGQEAARQLFLRLVTLGEGVEDTRRRVLRSELEALTDDRGPTTDDRRAQRPTRRDRPSTMDRVVEAYGRYRLLTFDRDPLTRGPTVEVAHEALLREWPRLRGWLEESRTDVRLERLLAAAAAEWSQAGQDPSYLLRGARLAQFESWAEGTTLALTGDEYAYLEASTADREAREIEEAERQRRELAQARGLAEAQKQRAEEQARSATKLRWLAIGLAVFLLLSIGAALLAVRQTGRAQEQTRLTFARELAGAALNNLDVDPERSILLALQAVDVTYARDGTVTKEAEEALHRAVQASRVLRTLSGHTERVDGVAYSPDGMYLASAGYDGTARIWDTTTGQELLTLSGHADAIVQVAFSPDGEYLATACLDGTAKVWQLEKGRGTLSAQEWLTLSGHTGPIGDIGFSPDGTRLATGSWDRTARVWDIETGRTLINLTGHSDRIWNVAFSPDGTRLATASVDKTAKVWDVGAAPGQELLTLVGHTGIVIGVDFSPDGALLATASDDTTIKIWNAKTGQEMLTLFGHKAAVTMVRFHLDSTHLATSSADGMAKIWALDRGSGGALAGREMLTLSGHTAPVNDIAFSPLCFNPRGVPMPHGAETEVLCAMQAATASGDKTVKVWVISPERELFTLSTGREDDLTWLALSPDGTLLITSGSARSATVWDVTTGQRLFALPKEGQDFRTRAVAFSPDGKRLATAGYDGTTKVWDISALPEREPGSALDLGSVQEHLTLASHAPGQVWLGGITGVTFSPDGTRLATASDDGTAKVWEPITGEELLTLTGHDLALYVVTQGVFDVTFSPDGTRLATAGTDKTARVWDAVSGQELLILSGHSLGLFGVDFSPDGTRLATCSWDGTARVWDTTTGQELLALIGHTGTVRQAIYNSDGTRLVTVGADGTVRVWDAETGEELLVLSAGARLTDVAYGPEERFLVAAGLDGAHFFVLPVEDLVALARSRVTRSLTDEECQQYLHVSTCPVEAGLPDR